MKYFAILKDSLRETIDSKVFFVVLVITGLFIGILATLQLKPNTSEVGLEKLVSKISDGAEEFAGMKVTQPFTTYALLDLQGPERQDRPWEAEYRFVVESRDQVPSGLRMAFLRDMLKTEESKFRREGTVHNPRIKKIQSDFEEEIQRIQEREQKKAGDRFESQQRVGEMIMAYFQKRLEEEVHSVTGEELEEFIREQLGSQGNWRVAEVKLLDLPEAERKIKIKAHVPVQEGEDLRFKMQEVEGEVNKFRVTLVNKNDTFKLWPHDATLFFGGIPVGSSSRPGELVYSISQWAIARIGAPVIMLLSCIITAFYIPNMLRKGTVDLLLAKPLGRVRLLVYKFVGGLTFMFLNTLVLILGLWLVLGVRSGVWELAFLLSIPVLVFEFAFFYALSTLAAIWTRSPVVSILFCVVAWGILFGVGWGHYVVSLVPKDAGAQGGLPAWLISTANGAHAALPHYLDLDWLCDYELRMRSKALTTAQREEDAFKWAPYRWTESILVTSLYIVGLLGLACWRFWAKDY